MKVKKYRDIKLLKNKRFLTLAVLLVLALVFKKILFLPLLIVLSIVVSYLVHLFHLRAIGLEFVTLVTALTGRVYGWKMGMIVGFVLILIHLIMSGHIGLYVLWVIPCYIFFGLLSSIVSMDFITLGILGTISINFIYGFFTLLTNPGYFAKSFSYFLTNIFFNFILFSVLGGPILSFMIS